MKEQTTTQVSSRVKTGTKTGIIGLITNFFLFGIKLIIGMVSNSIAIIADSFNSLSDCISSIITIFGFCLSGKQKDENHPYGHGRVEYISGLVVSILILFTAVFLGKTTVTRFFNHQIISISPIILGIIVLSIIVKLVLALYTKWINKELNSSVLRATIKDNFADALVTAITLMASIFMMFTTLPLDAIAGLVISAFIFWTGIVSLLENFDLLVGKGMSTETLKEITSMILSYDVFAEIKSLDFHDYGPQSKISVIQISTKKAPTSIEVKTALQKLTQELKEKFDLNAKLYCEMAI